MKLTYTNIKGESVEMGYGFPFFLSTVEGLGDVEADVYTQKSPYQDGSTFIDSNLRERFIHIELSLKNNDPNLRRILSRVFIPKQMGELKVEIDGEIRVIQGIPEHVPNFPDERNSVYKPALIDLRCPDPFWKSEQIVSEPMAAYRGLFRFPLTLPTQFGEEGTTQVFVNDGDVDTPVQIEFRGPATNPRVTNKTTGEFIQINKELEESDKLIVDTTFGNKRVEIIRPDGSVENVFNWIHPFSTFWNLIPGPNEIEYTAESGRTNAVVSIKWKNRYLAV